MNHIRSCPWIFAMLVACLPGSPLGAAEAATNHHHVYAVPDADASPAAVVTALEQALLQALRDSAGSDLAERRRRLGPVVARTLNHRRMSALVLGATWRSLDDAARHEFVELFEALSVATYAGRFAGYSGQQFELESEADTGERRAVVRTRMLRPKDDPVPFTYQLVRDGDQWRIVSIQASGVSDLAIRRSQYARLHAQGGFEAVLADLRAEIDKLLQP